MKFEIDKDSRGQFVWRLKAANGRIIANGESYTQKQKCEYAIALVKASRLDQFWVYQDKSNLWRWRFKADNGEIVAHSSESYYNQADCESAARMVYGANSNTPVIDLTVAAAGRW